MTVQAGGLRGWVDGIRPEKGTVRDEAIAGLPGAIGSVPDGMAAALLTGVNPVFGLYASFAGPIAGGLTASTRLMVITTTSAAALAAGSAIAPLVGPRIARERCSCSSLLAGVLMVAAGLLRLGRYTRFVSHSVMIGFLTGVAVNIVAGQIPDLAGAEAGGQRRRCEGARRRSLNPSIIHLGSLLVGLAAIAILLIAARTPWATFGAIVALAIPTLAVVLLDMTAVATVSDIGEIPRGHPAAAAARPESASRSRSSPVRLRLPRSSSCREPALPSRRRTATARDRTPTRTSSRRGSATSHPGCSAGFRSAARSARPR